MALRSRKVLVLVIGTFISVLISLQPSHGALLGLDEMHQLNQLQPGLEIDINNVVMYSHVRQSDNFI